tara:strand:+ start:618 stop:2252 length:1635 start_codon:yes stop_codon:yes gene_type:complete
MIKNTANQYITFGAIAVADGSPVTTGTPAVYLSKDGNAQATATNTATHAGNGLWQLELTQAETNADHLSAVLVLANAVNAFNQAYPLTLNDFKSDATAANQTSISNAIAALNDFDPTTDTVTTANASDVTAVKAVTDKIDTMVETDTADIFSGFESGFDGWTAVAYFGGNASDTTVSTAEARTGSQSIRMENDGDNGSNDRTGIVRTETFGNGATVSGYLYSTNSFASSDERVEFWVDGSLSASQNPTAGQTWEAFSFNVTAGSHAIALVRYSDENANSANVHLDDITITGVASTDYQYTAESLDQAPSGGGGDATLAKQNTIIADIAALNDFDPSSQAVANVTTVGTCTTNSDMRGTDNANTLAPANGDITGIKAKTDSLTFTGNDVNANVQAGASDATAANQVAIQNAIAALNDFDPGADTVAQVSDVALVAVCTTNSDMRGTDSANTIAPDNAGITANGVAVASLNDFDPATQAIANVTNVATTAVCVSNTDMRGTDGANTVVPDNAGIAANGTALAATTKTGVQYTATAQSGDTIQVTLS